MSRRSLLESRLWWSKLTAFCTQSALLSPLLLVSRSRSSTSEKSRLTCLAIAARENAPVLTGSYDTGDPLTTNIHVGGLPQNITEAALGKMFAQYGPIGSVKVSWTASTMSSRPLTIRSGALMRLASTSCTDHVASSRFWPTRCGRRSEAGRIRRLLAASGRRESSQGDGRSRVG